MASLLIEWKPKVTTIEEATYLKANIMEELLWSFIIHEHAVEKDKEKEVSKKKKNLAVQLLLKGEMIVRKMEIWLLFQGNSMISW